MIKIKEIVRAGGACPYQLYAITTAGSHLYLRYRWGTLSFKVTPSEDTRITDYDYSRKVGDDMDGFANDALFKTLLKDLIEFPSGFTFDKRIEPQEEDDRE